MAGQEGLSKGVAGLRIDHSWRKDGEFSVAAAAADDKLPFRTGFFVVRDRRRHSPEITCLAPPSPPQLRGARAGTLLGGEGRKESLSRRPNAAQQVS